MRSCLIEFTWNYERMMHLGCSYALAPILKKLYSNDPKKLSASLKRHQEFFNITPQVSTFLLGLVVALEERNSNEENFDTNTINNIKASLMGPLSGIGDSLLPGSLRIVATGIGTQLALQGSILGPILFLLIFNIPAQFIRFAGAFSGYNLGINFLEKIEKTGLMPKISYSISILGSMVIGSMIAYMIYVNLGITIGSGSTTIEFQSILDEIMPGILPPTVTAIIYFLLQEGMKVTHVLIGIFLVGILGNALGILA